MTKKSDNKIRVIIRAVVFVLIFVGIFCYLEGIFHDDTPVHPGWQYVYHDDIDVLIMGSSQVHYAIDAKLITDETGLSVVEISSGAQSIKQTYYNLVEALEQQEPDLVVIEAYSIVEDTLTWMEANGTLGLVLAGIDDMDMGYNKLNAAFSILKFEGYPVFHILRESGKTERMIAGIEDIAGRNRGLFSEDIPILDPQRGYMRAQVGEVASNETYQKYKDVVVEPDYVIVQENLEYLDRVIDLCQREGVALEFVKTPLLKRAKVLAGMVTLEEYFVQQGYDCPIYNLMDVEYGIVLGQEHYADYNHINHEGAQIVSRWFIDHFNETIIR